MEAEPSEWFRGFFDPVANSFWEAVVPVEVTRQDVAFLRSALGLQAGDRLLDAPCGAGRLALPLAALGWRVTGVDLSADALKTLRTRASERALRVEAVAADLRELPLDGPFDGACCMGNSFGYFDPEGMAAFARRLGALLRPSARFVVETAMAAESILPNFEQEFTAAAGDLTLKVAQRYNVAESRVDAQMTFGRGSALTPREQLPPRATRHYVLTCREIVTLLERAGLCVRSLYSDTHGSPYVLGEPRLIVVAERA